MLWEQRKREINDMHDESVHGEDHHLEKEKEETL